VRDVQDFYKMARAGIEPATPRFSEGETDEEEPEDEQGKRAT
jgi:hypothetical protein